MNRLNALEFIRLMSDEGVLRFGDFTLKSGKRSPYFFNLGNVSSGIGIQKLGQAYARCILDNDLQPEVLFGPAYKGIPFVVTTAIALANEGINVGVSFNRKEIKGYGEGGWLIGSQLDEKRVVMIDDVVMDGQTKVETAELIRNEGGILSGIVIGIDRQETLDDELTAVEALSQRLHTQVFSVSTLETVLQFLNNQPTGSSQYEIVKEYARSNCKLASVIRVDGRS